MPPTKSIYSPSGIIVAVLGAISAALGRYVVDRPPFPPVYPRFLLFAVLPLSVFLGALAIWNRGRRFTPRVEKLVFRVASLCLVVGFLAGTVGTIVIVAGGTIDAVVREAIFYAGLLGFLGAGIVAGMKFYSKPPAAGNT